MNIYNSIIKTRFNKLNLFCLKILVIAILAFTPFFSYAQSGSSVVTDVIIIDGDTLPVFDIPEVTVVPAYKFTSKRQKRRYTRLVKNIKKVYPYAKMANQKLDSIYAKIDTLDNQRLAKKYIKQVDKELREQYGDELKKLTISQGRILIKLIDRETGSTSYALIKELRGSFSAFMWQSLARVFGENLKDEYDAEDEDKMIEHIIMMIDNDLL